MTVRVCNKVPYETRHDALEDIKHIHIQMKYRSKKNNLTQKSNRKMWPYECHWCGKWHTTTTKQK